MIDGYRYLAPEYFMHGIVDEKTDVFAFGVLLLELITGRRAVDSNSRESLVIWVSLSTLYSNPLFPHLLSNLLHSVKHFQLRFLNWEDRIRKI